MTQQDDITPRVLTDDEIRGEIHNAIGFGFEPGELQSVNAADLMNVAYALLSKLRAPVADERAALADLLDYVDSNTCIHESTHRGGAIWTICDGCGMKWADDEGGFVPHQDAPAVAAARAALASAPVQPPNGWACAHKNKVANAAAYVWYCKDCQKFVNREPGDTVQSASAPVAGEATYYAVMHGQALFGVFETETAANECIEKSLHPGVMSIRPLYAAPQASALAAEYTRGRADGFDAGQSAALEKAAQVAYEALHPANPRSDWTEYAEHSAQHAAWAARSIRALKSQADKDGGQQRAGDDFDVEAAAKTMAECMDYPWAHMPEKGREQMRLHAQSVIRAALSAPQAEQGDTREA